MRHLHQHLPQPQHIFLPPLFQFLLPHPFGREGRERFSETTYFCTDGGFVEEDMERIEGPVDDRGVDVSDGGRSEKGGV